jgi:hypothetical protein
MRVVYVWGYCHEIPASFPPALLLPAEVSALRRHLTILVGGSHQFQTLTNTQVEDHGHMIKIINIRRERRGDQQYWDELPHEVGAQESGQGRMNEELPMKTRVRKAKIETAGDGRSPLLKRSPVLLAVGANTGELI